jgi:hypothetical protein
LLITELYTILETPPPVVESGPDIRYQMVTCWLDSGWTQACGSWPRSRRWLRTSREIEAAFATLLRDRADALFVAPDGFFNSRRVQLAIMAARHVIPEVHPLGWTGLRPFKWRPAGRVPLQI